MSDYHILTQDEDSKGISAVFHIPIPAAGSNAAGVQWRNAIVLEQKGAVNITSVLPELSGQAEEVSMKAGIVYERLVRVRFSSTNLTDTQRKQEVENKFNIVKAAIIAEKQKTLSWIGFAGDVV
jgi:hypothetical protein